VTIKFTQEAIAKGYSFLAGEAHRFPDEIGELMILDGVAFRVAESATNREKRQELKRANERDYGSNDTE
jgi:hypothetical protein